MLFVHPECAWETATFPSYYAMQNCVLSKIKPLPHAIFGMEELRPVKNDAVARTVCLAKPSSHTVCMYVCMYATFRRLHEAVYASASFLQWQDYQVFVKMSRRVTA